MIRQFIQKNPYARLARLDKPVGTYLLLWPGYWSIAFASTSTIPDPVLLAKFGVGALVMRSAGCTINDMLDKDFDSKVERTRTRPLASGELKMKNAILFLGAQLSVGLGILLSLKPFAIYWGVASMVPVCLYPLSKRYLKMPQLVLGLTFNWGAILGWAAAQGSIDWNVILPLYIGSAAWTLGYDTIYAHQDKNDDKLLGINSSALTIGDKNTKAFLTGCYAFSTLCMLTAGMNYHEIYDQFNPELYALGVCGMGLNLTYQVYSVNINDSKDLAQKFKLNQWVGPSLFMGIILAKGFS